MNNAEARRAINPPLVTEWFLEDYEADLERTAQDQPESVQNYLRGSAQAAMKALRRYMKENGYVFAREAISRADGNGEGASSAPESRYALQPGGRPDPQRVVSNPLTPDMPADEDSLRAYLRGLKVAELRAMAADGMMYRHESKKAEIVEWLVRYLPRTVREHRARG